MPAKSKAQLKKAGAACGRGEQWGCEMVKATPKGAKLPAKVKKAKRK